MKNQFDCSTHHVEKFLKENEKKKNLLCFSEANFGYLN